MNLRYHLKFGGIIMKRKSLIIFIGVSLISLLIVGTVLAFGMGNADGVWEYVEDVTETSAQTIEGAECSNWATGPASSSGDISVQSNISNWNPNIQTGSNTDENQVRYGRPDNQACSTATSFYNEQSGLGFDGNNNVGSPLVAETPFWVGRLTHYNKPINLTDIGGGDRNFLEFADIDITVSGIVCGNGSAPSEGSTLTFTYRIGFVETPNNGEGGYCGWEDNFGNTYECPYTIGTNPICPYDGGINDDGCSDRVQISSAPPAASFTCEGPGEPIPGIYTIKLLGFQPVSTYNGCSSQTYNSGLITSNFITQEQTTNHACLWAIIDDFEPTSVTLKDFSAEVVEGGVVLSWETTNEVNTLGFNLYRAEAVNGDRVKVNQGLIFSQLAAGSLDGASYSFNDGEDLAAGTYYYWLEEVEQDGNTDLFGPAEAVID